MEEEGAGELRSMHEPGERVQDGGDQVGVLKWHGMYKLPRYKRRPAYRQRTAIGVTYGKTGGKEMMSRIEMSGKKRVFARRFGADGRKEGRRAFIPR